MKTPSVNSRILKIEVLKDTATRTSVNAVDARTTSLESDVATAQSDISTLQGNVTTLTQGIVDARDAAHTAGVITQPSFSAAADGASFTVGSNGVYALYQDPLKGDVVNYTIAGGTFPLADGVTTYLVAKYNSGSPVLDATTNREELDFQQVVPVLTLNREGATVHTSYTSYAGIAIAEKMHNCQLTVNRYQIERGALVLGASGQNVTVGAGYVWQGGVERTLCGAFTSVSDLFSKWVNVSGTWTKYPATTWENTYYQGATGQVELQNSNRFAVTHVFRTVGDVVECLYVLGAGDYTLADALASGLPSSLPPIATTHSVYVGRIIAAKGATTAYSVQAPIRSDSYAPVSDHAALSNVLPIGADQHLTTTQREALTGVAGAPKFLRASIGTDITSDTQVSLHVSKGIRMNPIDSGPTFGTGFGVHAYRTTNENIPEAFLWRGAGYIFEDSGANWMLTIVPAGVNIGSPASFDLTEIPKSKLEVAGSVSIGALYARKTAAPANGLLVQGQVLLGKPTPVATKTTTKLEVGGETRFEARLDAVGGVAGAPATSGSTTNHAFRVGAEAYTNLAMDMGVYSSGLGFWLQARNSTDFSMFYPVRINPNGGDVQLGSDTYVTNAGLKTGAPSGQSVANWKFGAVSNGYAHVSINGSNYKIAVTPE